MKRLLIAGTIAFLAAIMVSTAVGQDSLLQAFTSSDAASQVIRLALIGLLASLLFVKPPRSIQFRTALSIASAALTFGVTIMLSQYQVAPLDALLFIEAAIIFALEAMESPVSLKVGKKIPVVYRPQNEKIVI